SGRCTRSLTPARVRLLRRPCRGKLEAGPGGQHANYKVARRVPLTGKETFGPYRLLSPIKISQNTQIWVVMNDSKQQRYAMKTLLARCAHNREQVGLLRQEFAVGTSLKNKRIIEMYELSEERERPFVIMELFQAPNMKEHIQKGIDP